MTIAFILSVAAAATLLAAATPATAQDRIYRCGNEYTNSSASAKQRDCKLVEGGNVTVIQGTRPSAAPQASGGGGGNVVTAPPSAPRIDTGEQRARDSDARAILEGELRRAEARQADLLREYANGTPERLPNETADNQKYRDRVAELKASIARNDGDIAGIKREIARLPASR
ncbi:hypothetical protein [Xylophilus ampelinus]|uniref:DUF4124 domain-containing protein n=1 Tax=Xylophilus ampelinus TaxID=54067 RepID=A0A318SJN3_9BURK|nr:hypothetical protein [Xylophilus ampelinus]MCS4509375.1 hypothetical protein [Xylophilus ampelinus]PYE79097.1 hypothetical protein DFQ15_10385 [Xylophilus ampelinus]